MRDLPDPKTIKGVGNLREELSKAYDTIRKLEEEGKDFLSAEEAKLLREENEDLTKIASMVQGWRDLLNKLKAHRQRMQ